MKNGILICVLALLLAACQQPTVYVFSENLQDEQRNQLDAALSAQNLSYEYVPLVIPSDFGEATLLLSSDKIYQKETEQLAIIMQEPGRVDLCGLKFVQSRGDLIAARGL
ncbi:hypothetical protein [Pseudoalteromonas carrageenovora]|uniref:hypothetical protein n=1 Tax=Pseudoalteromonas carrageenovora TaxID=227 RepID=UPI003F603E18